MSKRSGGIGPTGSRLIQDGRSGTVKFTTYDPADGALNTNAPSFYQKHEVWKKSISSETFKQLLGEVLQQHFRGNHQFRISKELAQRINCPDVLSINDLNWMKTNDGYEKIFLQEKSKYLGDLLNSK